MFAGRWIWENGNNLKDEHIELRAVFAAREGEKAEVRISCDTDFTLYVNGKLAGFGQYPDYPNFKFYETADISAFVRNGENVLAIEAYHGGNCSTHWLGKSGIVFDVLSDGKVILSSGDRIQCRLSRTYRSHAEKYVTGQLGCSYAYDATKEDGWREINYGKQAAGSWHDSVEISGMAQEILPRPVKKLALTDKKKAELLREENGKYFLYDLGREEVGYPCVCTVAEKPCKLRLSWGEHIADGCVRREIEGRDFSVEITVPQGKTEFSSYFLRFGARYLQIESEAKTRVEFCGLRFAEYPLRSVISARLSTPLRQKIYDTCVRTLRLCMHEHYEDCPWREQAMYALDSRNQMLCGYFAFGEYEFARASLELMCNAPRPDGFMPICFPSDFELKIPSFSLYFFMQMREYAEHSGDLSLYKKYEADLTELLGNFLSRFEDGLSPNFYGDKTFWNFYEWADGLSGEIFGEENKRFDLILNCLISLAVQNFDCMRKASDKPEMYREVARNLNERINETFFVPQKGIYRDFSDSEHYSEFGNALAVLCGAATGERARAVAEKLAAKSGELVEASLSTAPFVYDALISVDKGVYAEYVLKDIDEKYSFMLSRGATSVWETLAGESGFGGAGSLCHGWSAMPIYYYHILGQVK